MFTPSFNPTETMIRYSIADLQTGYRQVYGSFKPKYADLIAQAAMITLTAIAHTDALYHDVEHTILVTMVGQEILRGKYLLEGAVTPPEWTHFILALLCHDLGYLKGICRNDQPDQHRYATGVELNRWRSRRVQRMPALRLTMSIAANNLWQKPLAITV